jgi:signal transduction histidine kinase
MDGIMAEIKSAPQPLKTPFPEPSPGPPESLRPNGAGFERLAQAILEPVFVQSEDRLVFANLAGLKLAGAPALAGLLGQSALSLFSPADQGAVQTALQEATPSGDPAVLQAGWQRLEGRAVAVTVAVAGTLWNGRPAVQLVVRDHAQERPVEAALGSLATFAQFNPNPILEFSAAGRLVYFNRAAEEMAQSLGRESPQALLPEEISLITRTCLASGQKKALFETALDGRTFSWSFFPVVQNQVVHCHIMETTERQKLEAQLRHSQKLESVGRLAAGAAHDFNNILTVIQGHIGLLKSGPGLSAVMSESLQQVSQAAERAGKLTSQLLAFSRKTVLAPRRLDLNEVLTNVSMMLQRSLGEDIHYQFCFAPSLPALYADLGTMEQIVLILAMNARDAMPRGGQLVIRTSELTLDQTQASRHPEARPGRFVCLSVVDSGCGMDSVTLARIFEPFFTTKEFGKGTGLGLAVVYGIVKQHLGWIEVQSAPGQGSTFRIYLPPATAEQEQAAVLPTGRAIPGGRETILLVEDEPPVRWITKNILERFGYQVLEAGNGVEALAVWHQHKDAIKLLLSDMVMPVGLSGRELAEQFCSQKPELKVIYTSGYSAPPAGKDLPMTEGVDFLPKPFDADQLALAVRQCLDG